jgi:hexosaminidase
MLDCGRYFMPNETVLKFIDVMAMHKQNMFHWHLTEDQGWRIEIKKYPRLTEIGSVRKETTGYSKDGGDGIPHGGFYTQEDVKEVVEYARRRCVTVIPEIEIPGHSMAALAAYPELACFPDRQYEVATSWGVKKDVYCPKEFTFNFLEDVFTELFDLFPSHYYHIGGDECPRDRWKECTHCQNLMKKHGFKSEDEIQIYFVQRMANFLKEKGGKTIIGWDEIIDGGAVPGSIVMSYRGHAPAMRATRLGMNTILTPNRWNYLDYYQEDPEKEEKSQGLFLPLEKVYKYFPIPDTIPAERHKFIIGQQGSLWTEFIATSQRAEYKAFPRAVAMAEVAWCDKPDKDWDSFRRRMVKGFERLDQKEVNYSRAFWNVIFGFNRKTPFPKNVGLTIDYPDATIHYTLNGEEPTTNAATCSDSIMVNKGDIIRAQGFLSNGEKIGEMVEKEF